MSPSAGQGVRLGIALFLAALVQSLWASSLRIGSAQPDFLLIVAIIGSLFCDANGAAALGLFAGLLLAALAAPPHAGFGSLIVSRTLVCFGVGWLEERIFRDNALIALAIVASGTALTGILFFLFDPQPNVLHWARTLLQSTLYNTLLALPLYLLMRRFVGIDRNSSYR